MWMEKGKKVRAGQMRMAAAEEISTALLTVYRISYWSE